MKNAILPALSFRTLLLSLALIASGTALGVGTPVGTSIENTATLNYKDSLGTTRNNDSNKVTVLVRQVYAVSVETSAPENAIPAARQFQAIAGNQRLISYSLQNAGNGTDTFDLSVVQSTTDGYDVTTAIYLDADNNGVPDGPAITSTQLNAATNGVGDNTHILVQVTAPAGTPVGQSSNFSLKAVSRGDTSKFDDQNYAQLTVSAAGQISLSESVTPTGGVNPGATLTYTVSGSVTGAPVGAVTGVVTVDGTARDGVLVRVPISGETFTSVTASASSAGTPLPIYSTDNGVTWTATAPTNPATVTNVALLISGSGAFLPANSTFSLSFAATVPAGAAAGTVISSTATSVSDGNGNSNGTDPGEVVSSTPVTNTVNAVVSAVAGPFGFPAGNATGTYTFGGRTIDRNLDNQTVSAAVTAGTTVSFKHTIQNTGNATENLSAVLSGAPAGWTCTIQNVSSSDTLSSYSNPVSLAAGASIDIAVVCSVPVTSGAVSNTDLTLTVTPQGGTPDTTVDRIAQVVPAGAALLGNGDGSATTPPSTTNVTVGANPGQNASFPLELLNNGPVGESYTLTATVPGTVFYADTNCDGQPDGPAITSTSSVASGANICLVAVVPVTAGTPAGSTPVSFTATSTTEATRTSTIADTLRANAVLSGSFSPNGAQSTVAGGSVTYTHSLSNTGNSPVTANFPAYTSAAGLTYLYSLDNTTFTSSLNVNVAAGASTPVYVKVSVPAGFAGSVTETATITANLSSALAPNPTLALSATDATTVQSVTSSVVKSAVLCSDAVCTTSTPLANNAQVSPNDYVRYTVVATNSGTGTLFGSYLVDSVPANTDLISVGGSTGVLYSVDDGQSWNASVPAALPLNRFWVGFNSDGNTTVNSSDALAPNASFTLILTVRVK
ncbi:beta strand repeat-containing protein [Deinococcus altitudinis]|uniref:beta strand repeat-containing protein n=1 Tax=Deinococcus altitudinis TaxID=468914 RepID=UPI00389293A2